MRTVKKCYYPLLILFMAALLLPGCTSRPEAAGSVAKPPTLFASLEDKFIGEWQSLESAERPHLSIIRNGDNYIIQEEEEGFPAVFDEENKILQFNVPASVGPGGPVPGATFDIAYIEKEDMLLVSGGGKYKRVSSSN